MLTQEACYHVHFNWNRTNGEGKNKNVKRFSCACIRVHCTWCRVCRFEVGNSRINCFLINFCHKYACGSGICGMAKDHTHVWIERELVYVVFSFLSANYLNSDFVEYKIQLGWNSICSLSNAKFNKNIDVCKFANRFDITRMLMPERSFKFLNNENLAMYIDGASHFVLNTFSIGFAFQRFRKSTHISFQRMLLEWNYA